MFELEKAIESLLDISDTDWQKLLKNIELGL